MLRMGRSNKPEPAENEQAARPTNPPPSPARFGAHTEPSAPTVPPATQPSAVSPALNTPTPPRAVSETESLARDIKDGLIGGFVGVHSIVTGETNFKGMLRVDGRVAGRISSQDGTLIVSSGGQVDANIEVAVARVNGTINGDIKARERIELGRTAHVYGNIHTPALVIEQGAIFEGSCRMSEQPAEQTKPSANAATAGNTASGTASAGKE